MIMSSLMRVELKLRPFFITDFFWAVDVALA